VRDTQEPRKIAVFKLNQAKVFVKISDMKKYWIITFGCQMNHSDSERIAVVLENMNYKLASAINEADLIVINMCSVRQSAVDRVYGKISDFAKLKIQNPKLKTVLTGCILKKDRKKFKNGFDQILNFQDLLKYQPKYSNNFSAFIPISNGCNNSCAYCVIPFTRGPLVCRGHQEILKEAENVIQKKYKEIWLLGQNVNDYISPTNPSVNFARLLKQVNDIPGNFWIRFTSPNPKDFSDELIDIMAESEKVTEYLNLPVQSGDDEILKKMNRSYTVEQYKNLVKKIREKISEIALSTDVIVGFPKETKKQFENTVKLLEEIKFDMAYIAKYSPRPGTAAAKMKGDVPHQEKGRRWKILTEILKQTALEKNRKYIGREIEVLVDGQKNEFFVGKTRTYKTVKFLPHDEPKALLQGTGSKNLIGQFVKVKIIDALPWGLKGRII